MSKTVACILMISVAALTAFFMMLALDYRTIRPSVIAERAEVRGYIRGQNDASRGLYRHIPAWYLTKDDEEGIDPMLYLKWYQEVTQDD